MLADPFDSVIMADMALTKILGKLHANILSKHITKLTPLYALADAKSFLAMTLHLAGTFHDYEATEAAWVPSEEPIPSTEDVCARASLDIEEEIVFHKEQSINYP